MKILIFNWRDIKNPQGGGAEILTHEMAKRWVAWGHEVVQFSAYFPGAQRNERIDNISLIRRGTAVIPSFGIPIHITAFIWYLMYAKGKFDIVIDEIHGIPFFTPWFVKEKKVALICEVAREIWDANFRFPMNAIGKFIENHYLRIYKKTPFLTISPSTEHDLVSMGIQKSMITVLPMGLSIPKGTRLYPKEKYPTLVFVGRLSRAKGVADAIDVINLLTDDFPNIRLWIIGQQTEPYFQLLQEKVHELKLENAVLFTGFVSQKRKFELMSRAHILIAPSVKEGWGLIVPEAGFVGTPAIVYNVAGLRDLVADGQNGCIVENNPEAMVNAVSKLLHDPTKYRRLQEEAKKRAITCDWDRTAKKAIQLFTRLI